LARAGKAIELSERLKRLYAHGKLSADEYRQYRVDLDKTLAKLKKESVELIERRIRELDDALKKVESEKVRGEVSNPDYEFTRKSLILEKGDLESERDETELCVSDDYLRCLQRQIDEKKYTHYLGQHIDPKKILWGKGKGDPGEDFPPAWAFAVALMILTIAFIHGSVSGVRHMVVLMPLASLFAIIFATGIMHMSTVIAGIEAASPARAFKTVMLNIILLALSVAGLLFIVYLLISPGFAPPGLAYLLLPLFSLWILSAVLAYASTVFSVYSVYEATSAQALIASGAYWAVFFTINVVVQLFIFGGRA